MNLSPVQSTVVNAPDRHFLVVAAAGSGKTRVITERVRFLIAEKQIRSRILVLTFTNKAAEEMRNRLQTVSDLHERAYIGTIHSFCQSIIESHGRVLGFNEMPTVLEREADRIAMLETAFNESPELRQDLMRHNDSQSRRKFLYGALERISLCKRDWELYQKLSSETWSAEHESRAFHEYQDHLASQGVIDFDDILLLALKILTDRPSVAKIYQRSYQYLCVDEAQDLNAVQYALIRVLGSKAKSILMVGDPNQSIYGFNGSNHQFMLEEFPKDFAVETVEFRENYRSSKAVIRAANALYPNSNKLGDAALTGDIRIVELPDEIAEAEWVTDQIQSMLDKAEHPEIEGRITLERMVVLARNRFVFASLQEKLQEKGVEFYLRQPNAGALMDSDAGKVLDLALRMVINPRNRLNSQQLCQFIGAADIESSEGNDPLELVETIFSSADMAWHPWLEPLATFVRTVKGDVNRFRSAVEQLIVEWGKVAAGLAAYREAGEQALADLKYLLEIWGRYIRRVGVGERSLTQFRNQMSTGEIIPLVNGSGLMLAPVHTVKGLEFDIVFLIGMVEGTFPDYRAVKSGGASLAEEKNDAFVAVTRAKRWLYLTWPQEKFMPWDQQNRVRQTRSRYLDEIATCLEPDKRAQLTLRVAEKAPPYGTDSQR